MELKSEFGAPATAAASARSAGKARHRRRILEAAIETLAEDGFAGATVSRILARAGLSRGMINLHFTSKDQLLVEAARAHYEAYAAHWTQALAAAGDHPADRLRALIDADFDPAILNPRTTAVWFALRGEVRARPALLPFVDTRDARLRRAYLETCRALRAAGPYPRIDPKAATQAFIALLEGMWSDFHLHPERFDRAAAKAVCLQLAEAFFPAHFPAPDGGKS